MSSTAPILLQCACPSAADANLHPYIGGVCPSVVVIGLMQDQEPEMIGFLPLDQLESSPPPVTTLYRKYSVSGTVALIQTNTPSPPEYPYQESDVTTGNGLSPNYYDPTTGLLVNGTIQDGTDTHVDPTTGDSTTSPALGALLGVPPNPGLGVTVTSATVATQNGAWFNFTTSSTDSSGSITVTLSDPDTESDAIGRAAAPTTIVFSSDGSITTPPVGGTIGGTLNSVWETPTYLSPGSGGPALQFDYRTAKYCLICNNLFAGLNYKVTVNWQKRTVGNGSTGAWVADTTDVMTFNASGSSYAPLEGQYILNGTWVDANSDGLIQASEVTPVVDLPFYQGYEVQIASIIIEWVP